MPRRRKAKKTQVAKPDATSKKARQVTSRRAHKKVSNGTGPAPTPPPKRQTRSGLRSRPSTNLPVVPTEADPEALLRKARKKKREAKSVADPQKTPHQHHTNNQIRGLAQSIKAAFAGALDRVDEDITDNEEISDEASDAYSEEAYERAFNRSWGYLPPLDDEVAAIIETIIDNPDMAKRFSRTNAGGEDFVYGLKQRNVILAERTDPYADRVRLLEASSLIEEKDTERETHEHLWDLDQEKINLGSNEALFQRTIMMNLIGRHLFIYNRQSANPGSLDFSVEELWTCPPMPSRAFQQGLKFLTQPKPDLAVCFRREAAIPDPLWNELPKATRTLACFENQTLVGADRIFHFVTIEAKKGRTSTSDDVGLFASLNNASQALHNMFEFFRDAGHEEIFFEKVRFFSVVSSSEGVLIRIHRGTQEDGSNQGFIMNDRKDYNLRFEFQTLAHITKDKFKRAMVLEAFGKILEGYGVGVLRDLIRDAAQAISEKLKVDPARRLERQNLTFYRYGQVGTMEQTKPLREVPQWIKSIESPTVDATTGRKLTRAPSKAYSHATISDDMRSGTATPPRNQLQGSGTKGKGPKRPRSPSPDKMSSSRPQRKGRNRVTSRSNTSVEEV